MFPNGLEGFPVRLIDVFGEKTMSKKKTLQDKPIPPDKVLTVRIIPVGVSGRHREIWQVKLLGQWLAPLGSFQKNQAIANIKRSARRWGYKQLKMVCLDSKGEEQEISLTELRSN